MSITTWALLIPMANEESEFDVFIRALKKSIDNLPGGTIFLVVDNVSKDKTLQLCQSLSDYDKRFHTVWAPENKNVVDDFVHQIFPRCGIGEIRVRAFKKCFYFFNIFVTFMIKFFMFFL